MKIAVKKKLFAYCLGICIIFALGSCSSTQRISVKQTQEQQEQETIIESNVKFKELSLNFYNKGTL